MSPPDGPITTVDYHTAGEPFRIVTGGVPTPPGDDVPARRAHAMEHFDDVRRLLVDEPRGHADMYGCLVTPPDDADGDLGVLFFHNDGWSTACGHGTIALVTWALDDGVVARTGTSTRVVVDAPSGRLHALAHHATEDDEDRVAAVSFTNVASHAEALDLGVHVGGRDLVVDIGFGGAFYAIVDPADVGCEVVPTDLPDLIAHGRAIKQAIEATHDVTHPDGDHLSGIYGVLFVEDEDAGDDHPGGDATVDGLRHQRNVAIFADGEVDRSPTGSGVSARLAVLDARGDLPRGDTLVTTGIVGQSFRGRVVADADTTERTAVVTEVTGSAHRTGTHTFTLDPHDPLGLGFRLR